MVLRFFEEDGEKEDTKNFFTDQNLKRWFFCVNRDNYWRHNNICLRQRFLRVEKKTNWCKGKVNIRVRIESLRFGENFFLNNWRQVCIMLD